MPGRRRRRPAGATSTRKILSNIQEVRARGARMIVIAEEGDDADRRRTPTNVIGSRSARAAAAAGDDGPAAAARVPRGRRSGAATSTSPGTSRRASRSSSDRPGVGIARSSPSGQDVVHRAGRHASRWLAVRAGGAVPFVRVHQADRPEARLGVAGDRRGVVGRRVDHDPVVPRRACKPADQGLDRVGEAAPPDRGAAGSRKRSEAGEVGGAGCPFLVGSWRSRRSGPRPQSRTRPSRARPCSQPSSGWAPPACDLGLPMDAVQLASAITGAEPVAGTDQRPASQHAEAAHDATSSTRSISTASAQRSNAWSHQ